MSAAKHTPGPWHVFSVYAQHEVRTPTDTLIAVASNQGDARLLAAAPDLLEQLQRLLRAYREAEKLYDPNHDDAYTVDAHNAIAKALGGHA